MQDGLRFHNLHNIHVRTGLASEEQLKKSVNLFLTELNNKLPGKKYNECEIIVNLVTKDNVSCNYAYLWVENPEVYYILTGFNPDGTERVVEEDSEDSDSDSDDDFSFSMSSLKLSDIVKSKENKKKPKILKPLGPIMCLPGYEYIEEQSEKAHNELIKEEMKISESEKREPNDVAKPKYGFFECTRSKTTSIDEDVKFNILYGRVPNWVTEDMIRKVFERFAESKDSRHFKISIGSPCNKYPDFKKVTIDYGNTRRGTATFARQMTRKTKFVNPKSPDVTVECVFDYFRPNLKFEDKSRDNRNKTGFNKNKNNSFLNRATKN
jgi:hypothetical protein